MNFIMVPFAWLLNAFYSFTHNYALALIFFTVVVKLVLLVFNYIQQKSAQGQARIRPKMLAIRRRYEGRRDPNVQMEYSQDMMKLYQDEKVSRSSGCLPLLIQLPFIAILWSIINAPLTYLCKAGEKLTEVVNYIFVNKSSLVLSETVKKAVEKAGEDVSKFQIGEIEMISVMKANPEQFKFFTDQFTLPNFMVGPIDLSATPTISLSWIILIPILVGIFQFASSVIISLFSAKPDASSPEAAQMAKTMRVTNLVMTAMTVVFAFNMPAILGVYWIYQSILGTVIHIILSKLMPIPTYTEAEVEAIIADYNRDYVAPEIQEYAPRSLHYIDEDDEIYESEDSGYEKDESEEATNDATALPPRRLYDKEGNKIHSLHYIDDEDEEDGSAPSEPQKSEQENGKDND